jgi:carboxylate-amine ligase
MMVQVSGAIQLGGWTSEWAEWTSSRAYSVGIEEEVMILEPGGGALATDRADDPADAPAALQGHLRGETQRAVRELATSPHSDAGGAAHEAASLRRALHDHLARHGLAVAASGTHPLAVWQDVRVSTGSRYRVIHETMRELARREPTFALHVHIGVDAPERALVLVNRLRAHLPLLLALSSNSPFWQGRDSGLHSARIPIFMAFPRVGVPRQFGDYGAYVEAVDRLVRTGAIPDPTFLWWDVRLQPALGTVEVRIMDSQVTSDAVAILVALTLTIAHLELEEGFASDELLGATEVLDENRFLAARDGMDAWMVDLEADRLVPVREWLARVVTHGRDHADALGCRDALQAAHELAQDTGAIWQRRVADAAGLPGLMGRLMEGFSA